MTHLAGLVPVGVPAADDVEGQPQSRELREPEVHGECQRGQNQPRDDPGQFGPEHRNRREHDFRGEPADRFERTVGRFFDARRARCLSGEDLGSVTSQHGAPYKHDHRLGTVEQQFA